MARASLISQARGTRVHSTGTHRRLDRMPTPELAYDNNDDPAYHRELRESFEDNADSASFERMMRNNRTVGF